uniref:AlNc14C94G5795 protein n=1 Tax=Albugo laibachii Nc14 TaxID=890382 RepID=F0WGR8_9STRA|nr:AlNc14C94G5795 [Albugo laibachii Nc14]|eukprot:CCA20432.1 AlNc14C94G5795 [Albugo laibachii Nc14]
MEEHARAREISCNGRKMQARKALLTDEMEDIDTSLPVSAERIRPQLRCNACWERILSSTHSAQTCYRTYCSHLFCEKCAYKHFGGGQLVCPACHSDMSRNGINETTIRGAADPKRREASGNVSISMM